MLLIHQARHSHLSVLQLNKESCAPGLLHAQTRATGTKDRIYAIGIYARTRVRDTDIWVVLGREKERVANNPFCLDPVSELESFLPRPLCRQLLPPPSETIIRVTYRGRCGTADFRGYHFCSPDTRLTGIHRIALFYDLACCSIFSRLFDSSWLMVLGLGSLRVLKWFIN